MLSETIEQLSNEEIGKYIRKGINSVEEDSFYQELIRGINIIIAKGMENE